MSPSKVLIAAVVILVFFVYFLHYNRPAPQSVQYQHQHFYQKYSSQSTSYRVMAISDMDKLSRSGDHWKSIALYGTLVRDQATGKYSITWSPEREITSKFSEAGRSMELSDLCNYNGNLYSFDDRTGMVIVIEEETAYPVGILMDGNGKTSKGFKGEWCTVKDGQLFIGGTGKEWTDTEGNFESNDPLWVKIFSETGCVRHINWLNNYEKLREVTGTTSPGYLLHEAVSWVPSMNSWLFLPRRVSKEKYNAVQDEYRCSNIGLSTSDFSRVNVISNIGPMSTTKGFSSVKYVPFRENELIILKTGEVGETTSYIMMYDLTSGKVIMDETRIPGNIKFEGLEFL